MSLSDIKVSGEKSFINAVMIKYPELYKYIFNPSKHIRENSAILDFIKDHGIPPRSGEIGASYVSYEDTWDFIEANEDKHEWWML